VAFAWVPESCDLRTDFNLKKKGILRMKIF
jgi:hypothetical protein